jgi:hypothetical protein
VPERSRLALSESSRYGVVLALLICTVAVTIVSLPSPWRYLVVPTLQGASVLVAISRPGSQILWFVLFAIVLITVALAALAHGSVERGLTDLLNAAVLAVLPAVTVARVRSNTYVNLQTVLGAVCVYMVLGMIYASVDSGLSRVAGLPFFAASPGVDNSEYMYFSFITLTTVGYGDLTPGSGVARALSVMEALTGQLYLVTVIALLVSNFGRFRQEVPH